jgi:hypothetical protein
MFRKAALILMALVSLTIADANASSAVVVSCYFVPLLPLVMDPAQLLEPVMGLSHLAADGAAFVDCRQKGGTSPHIVVGWKERSLDQMVPITRTGKF